MTSEDPAPGDACASAGAQASRRVQAAPDHAVSVPGVPGQAVPVHAVPVQASPIEAVSEEAVSEEAAPGTPPELPSLGSVVIYSLTGRWIDCEAHRIDEIASAAIAAGWDREAILAFRDERIQQRQAWPLPVPASQRGEVGAARLASVLQEVRQHMSLFDMRVRDARQPLSQRDRALLADKPPHHGSV